MATTPKTPNVRDVLYMQTDASALISDPSTLTDTKTDFPVNITRTGNLTNTIEWTSETDSEDLEVYGTDQKLTFAKSTTNSFTITSYINADRDDSELSDFLIPLSRGLDKFNTSNGSDSGYTTTVSILSGRYGLDGTLEDGWVLLPECQIVITDPGVYGEAGALQQVTFEINPVTNGIVIPVDEAGSITDSHYTDMVGGGTGTTTPAKATLPKTETKTK